MKRLMVAFALMAVSGCLCAKECEKTEDCATGQICGPQRLCEVPGGGTGGGSAGGVGGGRAGGSTAGGSTGGGVAMAGGAAGGATGGGVAAGGAAGGCSCPVHQYCTATGGCLNYELAWVQPAENDNFAADASVTVPVAVTARQQDGGSLVDVQVPISGPNPSTTTVSGLGTLGALTFASPQSGTVMLQAGWPGGSRLFRTINVVGCENTSCQPYEGCVPSTTGGSCQPLGLTINWTTPVPNLLRGPRDPLITISLTVTADAGPLPSAVPISFDGGTVALAVAMGGATYAVPSGLDFTTLAGIDGVKVLTAGWPGFPSPTRSIRWDSAPPQFTIRIQQPTGRPASWPNPTTWRRDETALVEVGSNELLASDPVLSLVGADGGSSLVAANSKCGFSPSCVNVRCDCFSVDLAAAPLNGAAGNMGLSVSGRDAVLNPATQDGGAIAATRVRWQTTVPGLVSVVDPAMDTSGRLYIAGTDGGLGGVVAQVLTDGTLRWAQSTYGAVTAPVVWSPNAIQADAGVFVATKNATQAQIRALEVTSGTMTGNNFTCADGSIYSARMVSFGATVATAREVGNGLQSVYIAEPSSGNCAPTSSAIVAQRASLVGRSSIDGGYEVFAASTGNAAFNRLTTNPAGTTWTSNIDSLSGSVEIASLALGNGRAFMTRSGVGGQGVYAHNLSTGSPLQVFALTDGALAQWTAASLGQGGTVYFSSPAGPAQLYRTVFTSGSPFGSFTPNTQAGAALGTFDAASSSFSPAHAPILGHGGAVYTVSTAGELSVFQGNARAWFGTNAQTLFGAVSVAPLLDVARSSTGAALCGRPGTLYVVSNTGVVTSFIVDSQGLDRDAAWPRFQHDNANSGNADTQLSSWGCPP